MNNELFRRFPQVRGAVALTVCFGVLAAVATIAQMALLSRIVGRVFLAHKKLGQVGWPLVLLLGAIVVHAVLIWLREVTAQQGAIRFKAALRERLFAHVLRLGPAYASGERTGELVTTAGEGVERLDPYVSRYLPQLVLSVLVPLVILAAVATQDWPSAALLLVTAPIIPLLMVLVGTYAEGHIRQQWTALARMGAHFLDALQGLPTLHIFGRVASERATIARISTEFRDRTLKVLRFAFLSGLVLEFMTAGAIALVAVSLGARLLAGGISFDRAFFILLLAPEYYRPLRELGVHRHAAMEGGAVARRVVEVLVTPAPLQARSSAAPLPTGPLTIDLVDVSYTYPGNPRPALSHVDLTLPAGARTALVGRSGAGKSTLVNLLLRFIDPTDGRIMVNGISIAQLPVDIWREHVAFVPQRPHLFYGSVHDNIGMARPDATRQEIEWAAALSGAAEFIERLPYGYDTPIGERGSRLSGGEAQRIAIARAFLKDAPVLVLDEPTSSLDPASETLIRAAFERLMHNRTVLVVAHRLNTIYTAEQIAVLDAGRLAQTGHHRELLQRDGLYADFVGAARRVAV